ncbi:MAG: 50S ribosomal protein L22 [Chlamydiales bacterium]
MKEALAKTKYVRISPRKARLAAGLIRCKAVVEAKNQLQFAGSKASILLMKTLNSAIANAETRFEINREELVVREVRIDCGPTMKRAKSKCRGGRTPINKRTSHFTVVVGPKE